MKKILSALLCLLLLTGCAKEKGPYVPTGNALSDDEPTAPTSRPTTTQAMSLAYYPDRSLDPFRCSDYTNRTLFGLVYQGLFAVDEHYEAKPILCQSYTVSRDMKTYTFQIAPATFSDGSALTTADVAASLRYAMGSSYYGGRFGYVDSVTATEEAVTVTLKTPYENFPVLLDVPIVKADQVGTDRPLGTGPYIYETVSEKLCLRRRSDWWCVAALPVTAQRISLVEAEDPSQLRDVFEFQDLSLVCTDPGSDSYVDFHSDYELWDCESGAFLYLGCNAESPVLSHGDIQSCLTYAIDRQQIVSSLYRGFAQETTLPASPQWPHYDQALANEIRFEPQRLTDAVSAQYLESYEIRLLVKGDDSLRLRAARTIATTLESCGLTVTVDALATADYLKALEEGQFDLYLGQTKLSANMDLSQFFAPEGTLSFGGISDSVTAALCAESLANSGNYYTLHKTVLDSGAIIPIAFRSYAIFTQRGVFTDLDPARDAIFYYDLGKTCADVQADPQ